MREFCDVFSADVGIVFLFRYANVCPVSCGYFVLECGYYEKKVFRVI